jgi:uncharacterized protein (DUF1015 family)
MTSILPFRALRPDPAFAEQVASPPYDVLNSEEARQAVAGHPHSFLHVTKSEVDLPADVHPYSTLVYEKARETLQGLTSRGVLFREQAPCYYIYRLTWKGRSQTGLVCLSSVEDYNQGRIRKHEFTRPEKENDRINHIKITGAQTGNVFLAYENVADMDTLVAQWISGHQPAYDFTAADGVTHTVWVVDDTSAIGEVTQIFATQVPCTYIADGHHRAASAAKVREAMGSAATAGADYFLTTLFPAAELEIMDYNRVVKDLNGMSAEDFISSLQDDFMITLSAEPVRPSEPHEFGMYLEGQWYILAARKGTWTDDPIGVLDVTILSHNLLDKILGIRDQRTDKRIDFVGGIRGLSALEQRVDSGEMAVAFSIYPVTIRQLFAIADSGQVMPPKSTWFEPKLRDGLFTHLITD